jgi:hypothetical protein
MYGKNYFTMHVMYHDDQFTPRSLTSISRSTLSLFGAMASSSSIKMMAGAFFSASSKARERKASHHKLKGMQVTYNRQSCGLATAVVSY